MICRLCLCLLLIVAVVGTARGGGLAETLSNYARVTANNDNQTSSRYDDAASDATDYGDFDDLEDSTESGGESATTVARLVGGLASLVALAASRPGPAARSPRYQPDTVTKQFKYHVDQEGQPIQNYPPYNPLTANAAESYSQNGGKTSYEADAEQLAGQSAWTAGHAGYDSWSSPGSSDWAAGVKEAPYPVYQPASGHGDANALDYAGGHHHFLHNGHDEEAHFVEDDRESKRPYSYYFLGRKLWYIPLIFSVYFIIYVGALVLKSVARHKIQFPDKLWDLKDDHLGKHRSSRSSVDDITERYENAMETAKYKFM